MHLLISIDLEETVSALATIGSRLLVVPWLSSSVSSLDVSYQSVSVSSDSLLHLSTYV